MLDERERQKRDELEHVKAKEKEKDLSASYSGDSEVSVGKKASMERSTNGEETRWEA